MTATLLTIAVLALLATSPSAAIATGGELRQQAGRAGCISDSGSRGACARTLGLRDPSSVAVSPDGKHVYVAAGDGLTIFDRFKRTGALRAKREPAGCVSRTVRLHRRCQRAIALKAPRSVVVSGDGRNVYAGGGDAIAVFRRDANTGALVQPRGRAGCVVGRRGPVSCARGRALEFVRHVRVSPDGRSVYARNPRAIVAFDRDRRSGALSQKRGMAACVTGPLSDVMGCRFAPVPIEGFGGLAFSADGKQMYVATFDGVTVLDRDPQGTLRAKPGRQGCFSEPNPEIGQPLTSCTAATAVDGATTVAVSPDGHSVYVASDGLVAANANVASHGDALAVFDRDPRNGTLTQQPLPHGCVAQKTLSGCARSDVLEDPTDLSVSPDSQNVYVASSRSDALAIFQRDRATGALTQLPGPRGCVAAFGPPGGCAPAAMLAHPLSVTVSPDGRNVYATALTNNALNIFDRR